MDTQPSKRSESRRLHSKTRSGCIICKRRRVKCDEGRPRCKNCAIADRPCQYQHPPPSQGQHPPSQGQQQYPSPHSQASPGQSDSSQYQYENSHPNSHSLHQGNFTLLHMTLLHHAHRHTAEFLGLRGDCSPLVDLIIESAADAPYVLDQFLALSALHCSITTDRTDRDRANLYSTHATELQTRALATFNDARGQISGPNHIPAFIFTVLLGHHLLHTTLSALLPGGQNSSRSVISFTDFLPNFVHYMRVHRGVRSVTGLYWDRILDSKLSPLLYLVDQMPAPGDLTKGPETEALWVFLRGGEQEQQQQQQQQSGPLSPDTTTTPGGIQGGGNQPNNLPMSPCLEALLWVQWLIDMMKRQSSNNNHNNDGNEDNNSNNNNNNRTGRGGGDRKHPSDVMIQAIVAWPSIVPGAYVDALYQHRPEALVVLAFYAAILHCCRGFWVLGSVNRHDIDTPGATLVRMIVRHVGPAWEGCLAWPRETIWRG